MYSRHHLLDFNWFVWHIHIIMIRANVFGDCKIDNTLNNDINQNFLYWLSKSASTNSFISSWFSCISKSCARLSSLFDLRMQDYMFTVFWKHGECRQKLHLICLYIYTSPPPPIFYTDMLLRHWLISKLFELYCTDIL